MRVRRVPSRATILVKLDYMGPGDSKLLRGPTIRIEGKERCEQGKREGYNSAKLRNQEQN